tara:strand:- start:538 stop:1422 length:885 start_codon:yes stop_codon:yes gene_type:complete
MKIDVIGFYKIKKVNKPEKYQNLIKKFLSDRSVRGTVILSAEGINGTIAGEKKNVHECINYIKKKIYIKEFDSKNFSKVGYQPFNRAKIKIKKEVVPIGLRLTPHEKKKNKYIEPKKWNDFIKNKDVTVIDVRKTMEFKLGTFKFATDPSINDFRQFPSFFKSLNKNKKIAMFCTGGIRCEKAANFLRKKGFKEIYQLKGGILNYLKTVKKNLSLWKGECFVFDNRVSLKHKLIPGKYIICSACRTPISHQDKKSKKYFEDVSCPYCYDRLTKERKKKFMIRKQQKDWLKRNLK